TYAPSQDFSSPQMFINNGDPNGTWGLFFFNLADNSQIDLRSWSLTFTQPEPTTFTDAAGNYSFAGLDPGSYPVSLVVPPADVTRPSGSNTQTVTVATNQIASGVDFGVRPAPDLTGVAFNLAANPTAFGQNVMINYTITNKGAADAGAFDVELRLSNSGVIDLT